MSTLILANFQLQEPVQATSANRDEHASKGTQSEEETKEMEVDLRLLKRSGAATAAAVPGLSPLSTTAELSSDGVDGCLLATIY